MTEKIVLNATPDQYKDSFPNAFFSPPERFRSSEPGDRLQIINMIRGDATDTEAVWGFVPQWRMTADEPIYFASGATIGRKWKTSVAFRNWRCIVPATSFTWLREIDGVTMAYTISRSDGGVLLLAGIFGPNPPDAKGIAPTAALVTTAPNRMLAPHGLQMPLILKKKEVMPWLRARTNIDVVKSFIRPAGASDLTLRIYLPAVEHANTGISIDRQLMLA